MVSVRKRACGRLVRRYWWIWLRFEDIPRILQKDREKSEGADAALQAAE